MSVPLPKNLKISGDLTAGEDLTVDCAFDGSIQLAGSPGRAHPETTSAKAVSTRIS